ncbi:MAG: flippase [Thermoplasmatales archaeon]|nr:flippase [Thermoplasmatales archaeon]
MSKNEHRMARGTLYLMIAQVVFLGSGYAIHIGLARTISPIEYGRFGVILGLLMILQIFINMGIPETVSKFISEGRDTKNVKKKALQLQLLFSLILFLIIFLLAPIIADLLKDQKLVDYIRFASFIIPVRAVLSTLYGVLNGFRQFRKSAFVNIIYDIMRVIFVFVFIYMGFGVFGAIGGYIFGGVVALCFALLLTRQNKEGKNVFSKEIITFTIPLIGFAASYIIIMNLDIFFVKSLVVNQNMVGYYTAIKALSSIIFGVAMALSFTLLPSISKSYSKKDIFQTKSYINESMRYLLMILLPIGIIVALTSKGLINLFFPPEYVVAAIALSIHIFGIILISIFVVFGSVINGTGKPKISCSIGLILILLNIVLNYYLIKSLGIVGGAYSTLFVGILGVLLFSIAVFKNFHTLIRLKSFFRILFASIILLISIKIVDIFYVIQGYKLILFYFLFLGLYFLILFLLGEVNKRDIKIIKELF